jgi:glycosyltransferase involved in cell wall biosynthesis
MKNPSVVSFVIPVLNESVYLPVLLASIDQQRVPHCMEYEIIVVDHASIDTTRQIAESHPKVRYIQSAHGGPAAQRNAGASVAVGEWLVFCDAKIILPKNFLPRLAHKKTNTAYFPFLIPTGKHPFLHMLFLSQGVYFYVIQYFSPIMAGPCMILPRTPFLQVGGFSSDVVFEDVELSARISRAIPVRAFFSTVRFSPRRFYADGILRTTTVYFFVTFSRLVGYFPKKGTISYTFNTENRKWQK